MSGADLNALAWLAGAAVIALIMAIITVLGDRQQRRQARKP